jgi:uncharacterized protein YegP (UPF0339 family)
MATGRRKTAGTRASAAAKTESILGTGALRFDVYEENSGRHRWRLATSDGRDLATSCESFATRADAQRAAGEHRD